MKYLKSFKKLKFLKEESTVFTLCTDVFPDKFPLKAQITFCMLLGKDRMLPVYKTTSDIAWPWNLMIWPNARQNPMHARRFYLTSNLLVTI